MSFFSMLQMARGQDPPEPTSAQSDTVKKKEANSTPSTLVRPKEPVESTPRFARATMPKATPAKPKSGTNTTVSRHVPPPSKNTSSRAGPVRTTGGPLISAKGATHARPAAAINAPKAASKKASELPTKRAISPRAAVSSAPTRATPSPGGVTKKKLSFKDVMSQAAKINKSNLEVNLRTKNTRKQPTAEPIEARRPRLKPLELSASEAREKVHPEPNNSSYSSISRSRRGEPAPAAQPFPEVLEKRQRQLAARAGHRRRTDDDDDLADFIASEDEEEQPPQSDEIWRMFNRRPKHGYLDNDSDDDMEARGDDILNEERRSTLQAKREDAEEERKLAELAQRKRQRMGGV